MAHLENKLTLKDLLELDGFIKKDDKKRNEKVNCIQKDLVKQKQKNDILNKNKNKISTERDEISTERDNIGIERDNLREQIEIQGLLLETQTKIDQKNKSIRQVKIKILVYNLILVVIVLGIIGGISYYYFSNNPKILVVFTQMGASFFTGWFFKYCIENVFHLSYIEWKQEKKDLQIELQGLNELLQKTTQQFKDILIKNK